MTEEKILNVLDNSNDGHYCVFIELGNAYSYLIDTRLNAFRGVNNRWSIAIERLGYNPRAGAIILEIYYYGNCLNNLDSYNNRPTNYYNIELIEANNFKKTIQDENLNSDAKFWMVRGQKISLSQNKQDYKDAGIELKEYEPNEISAEEVGRLVVSKNQNLFRATNNELYKSIPTDLEKILVLDEWYFKEFQLQYSPTMTDDHIRKTYELNKSLTSLNGMAFNDFAKSMRLQEISRNSSNKKTWENNRPSSYETWQQIAKVIVTNETKYYKPMLNPNTHWKNWLDSGSL